MNMKQNIVYRTDDYSKFQQLEGNREVTEKRVAKIQKSIEENGYIYSPIICNELYEVIDGQGRLEVLKKLGLPVDYIVEPGLTIEDCKILNLYSTRWTIYDFIHSYATQGNQSYIYLLKLMEQFPEAKLGILATAYGGSGYGAGANTTGISVKNVWDGTLEISAEEYMAAMKALRFLQLARKYITDCRGDVNKMYCAVIFAYNQPEIDSDKLLKQIETHYQKVEIGGAYSKIEGAVEALSAIYNFKARGKRLNLLDIYRAQKRKVNRRKTQISTAKKAQEA